MPQPTRPSPTAPADLRAHDRGTMPRPGPRPILSVWDVVPVVPNLVATAAGFVALMAAPSLCLMLFEAIWEDAILDDQVASNFLLVTLEESFAGAILGAGVFLLIGAALQVWRHHRPFPAYRPILVVLLLAWALIIPEALARGGSVVSGGIVGAAVALAFAIQWGLAIGLDHIID